MDKLPTARIHSADPTDQLGAHVRHGARQARDAPLVTLICLMVFVITYGITRLCVWADTIYSSYVSPASDPYSLPATIQLDPPSPISSRSSKVPSADGTDGTDGTHTCRLLAPKRHPAPAEAPAAEEAPAPADSAAP